jgi:hypothetical protein
MVRQAMRTYDLFFYVNADERRDSDCHWKSVYTIVTLPLVRSMIDYLYNVTAILDNPNVKGPEFCKSGFKRLLEALDADETRYRGEAKWDFYNAKRRSAVELSIRSFGFTLDEVKSQKAWPTLGSYLRVKKGRALTPHQVFLKIFTYGMWRDYSALSHGAFEGWFETSIYYVQDSLPHDDRPKLDQFHPRILSLHVARSAVILLCIIITELQAYFRFEGARINERILEIWSALMPVFEVGELHREHYAQLMRDRGIGVLPSTGKSP